MLCSRGGFVKLGAGVRGCEMKGDAHDNLGFDAVLAQSVLKARDDETF